MNKYIGHELQLYGVEEVRLVGGKGDGMRMLNVKNATGLEFSVSLDRCADLVKVALKGANYGFLHRADMFRRNIMIMWGQDF